MVEADVALQKFCKVDSIALVRKVIRDENELSEEGTYLARRRMT